MVGYVAGQFCTDGTHGIGLTAEDVRHMLSGKKGTLYHTLDQIRRGKHKHSKKLKKNKIIEAMMPDYNRWAPIKTYIKLPFRTLNNKGETDDFIDDFNDTQNSKEASEEETRLRDIASEKQIFALYEKMDEAYKTRQIEIAQLVMSEI